MSAVIATIDSRRRRRSTWTDPGDALYRRYAHIRLRSKRAIAFIEGELRVPSGRFAGRPYKLLPFQRRLIRIALDRGHLHVLWSLPRGAGKTGLVAALAVFFLFDRPGAYVITASVGLRTARLSYDRAVRMIETSPTLAPHALVFANHAEPYVELPGRGAKLLPLPAAERFIVGFAASEAIIDEVGYVEPSVLQAIATGMGKIEGSLLLSIGTPGLSTEDADGVNAMYALRTLAQGDAPPPGLAYVEYSAPAGSDPAKPATWRRANPGLGVLVDPRAVALDHATLPPWRFAQMRLGQWTQSEAAWMRAEIWDALDVDPTPLAYGESVTLGFDGSVSGDATALVALRLSTRSLRVVECWERPPSVKDWQVPRDEVLSTIEKAFKVLTVAAMYADPHWWRQDLGGLVRKYGEQRVVEFSTNVRSRMAPATDAFYTAVATGDLKWDGDLRLRAHVIGAVAVRTIAGDVLQKDARVMHPQRIDLATAAILAHEAARLIDPPRPMAIW